MSAGKVRIERLRVLTRVIILSILGVVILGWVVVCSPKVIAIRASRLPKFFFRFLFRFLIGSPTVFPGEPYETGFWLVSRVVCFLGVCNIYQGVALPMSDSNLCAILTALSSESGS